ncbi:MAG: hypothetical protein JNM56_22425, partial [Planctomycetia bacterium]|nr:hypothetical protein [Planctomycetia bacterium]
VLAWVRVPLFRAAGSAGINVDDADRLTVNVRVLLIALCIVPILGLSGAHLLIRSGGEMLLRPAPGTFFDLVKSPGSHGVPLALLAVALVGHALRERKPSYAFSAGLLVNLAVMGGYALSLRQLGLPFDSAAVVRMLQLGSVAAALWALGWLGTRRWVAAWREDETPAAAPLMSAQLGLIAAGLAALLGGGVLSLTAWVPAYPLSGSEVFYLAAPWAEQVGAPLGWLPLVLGVLALVYRERQRQSWPDAVMLSGCGLALAALTACSIERAFGSSWGYRSLMLGWSTVALCCAGLAVWLAARREREAGLGGNAEALARGVLVAGLLTLVLALKAALIHHDYLWAAGALFLASTASAAVAVWRREEAWAFASGLGLNLVASLVVWHIFRDTRVLDWWWYLVQANSAACGLAALLWLAARKRFYGDAELRLASSPLLAVQILLGIVGNLPTLGLAFLTLLVAPDPGNTARIWLSEVGEALGWLSLGLPMIAALWYTSQATPRSRLPVGIAFALGVGVLGACGLSRWDTLGEWYGFHFLMVAWSTTALATLGLGLATVALQLAQSQSNPEGAGDGEPQTLMPWIVRLLVFPTRQIQVWVEVIGWLVVVLALRGAGSDDGGAFWSPGAALSVVFVTVGLALWARSPRYVWQSGLLLNLAGNLWLLAYGPFTLTAFIAVNVVCLGVGSVFWSALELALRTNALAFHLRGRVLGFNYVAALFGLIGLTMLTTLIVTANYSGVSLELAGTLTVAALFVTGLAIVLGFWDAQAPVGVGGLYLLGLEAVILGLHALHIAVAPLHGIAAATLAGYVLLTALLAWACVHGDVASLLKLPERTAPLNHLGLLVWQALTAVAVLVRSVQLVIDLAHPEQRWLGPLSVTLLTPVGVLLCASFRQRNNFDLRHLTFLLAGLGLVEWSWAFLPAEIAVPWLHRNVLLMTMVAVAAVGCAALRRRLLDAWSQAAGNAASCFGGLAGLALVVVLGQEAMLFDRSLNRAPTEVWAALLVVAALAGVIVAVLCFALRPESDPLQLSEERRTAYVYAAEVLAALLFAHLRLTMPWLFNPLMAQYWTFGVMALAFAGVGLAELFKRRGLQVLAGPLQNTGIFLPLLPLLALWLKLPAAGLSGVVEPAMPGSRLLFGYFEVMPWAWHKYALLWCLACLLYSLVALSRLSFRFAVVAALAGNFALWSLWQYAGLPFFAQPQLWLIPLGLILLASEHLNRANLQPVQSLSLRYAGLGLIYLSSTADLFLKGLGDLWLSLALMVLSVVGVFAGIVLRIRAYLFLGFGFLFLVIFSMIWHAAVDLSQTWVWWATGIVLGVAILALFAVFEKRRNDVLRMVEQIKQWG